MRPTTAFIDLNALRRNVCELKKLAGDKLLMAVVKANAYGHGSVPCALAALESGADWLGVAIPEEGFELRSAGITAPILVLGACRDSMITVAITHNLSFPAFDAQTVIIANETARTLGKKARLHIKIDSGMGRIGLRGKDELNEVLDAFSQCEYVALEGVFTHFSCSDWQDKEYTRMQAERFTELVDIIKAAGYSPIVHASNSGASLDLAEYYFDMLRPGIVLYGYYPSGFVSHDIPLLPVMRLTTSIVHIKTIENDESVSYNRTFTATGRRVIATIPIGYGDGYKRAFSNRAFALVGGKRVPVVGNVCMDQAMLDITNAGEVSVGDQVVLLGAQGDETITADELAAAASTISYEILLSISPRVPREYKR